MRYGKVFDFIFDSSINEEDISVRWVWIAAIVLSDENGILDMTPEALARRCNLPVRKVKAAIEQLSRPDPSSRSTESEGRRLVLLDENRPWGWLVVTKEDYIEMKDFSVEREKARERKKRQRDREHETRANPQSCHADVTPRHAMSHHKDEDKDKEEEQSTSYSGADAPSRSPEEKILTPQQQAVKDIEDAYRSYDETPPKPGILAKWIKDHTHDGVLAKIHELGPAGQLANGPAYVFAALKGGNRHVKPSAPTPAAGWHQFVPQVFVYDPNEYVPELDDTKLPV